MIKGFGGIFWRTGNLEVVKKWYSEVLKIEIDNWNGTIIKPHSGNETAFSFFTEDDPYFPTEQQVMLNFQVHDLNETIKHLEHIGVPLVKDKRLVNMESLFGLKILKVDRLSYGRNNGL